MGDTPRTCVGCAPTEELVFINPFFEDTICDVLESWPSQGSSRGVAKLVKAPDFDSGMRGFESFLPCQINLATAAFGGVFV